MLRRYLRYIVTGMAVAGILALAITLGNFDSKRIYAAETTAASLSDEDVQDAIDYIEGLGGGTVNLPSGSGTWDADVTIGHSDIDLVGAGANVTTVNTNANCDLTIGDGCDNVRVTGISFVHTDGQDGVGINVGAYFDYADEVYDFRIDHCDFWYYGDGGASISVNGVNEGLIDHNNITCASAPPSSSGYGVVVYGSNNYTGDTYPYYIESVHNVFVEDNQFFDCRHAIAANRGSHYVFRYNFCTTDYNAQAIDSHGQTDANAGPILAIAYENTLIYEGGGGNKAIMIRGGQGILYNNDCTGFDYIICWSVEDHDYLAQKIHDSYEWNNGNGDVGDWFEWPNPTADITVNVDYFPDTEYPSYSAYTYPHPLQSAGSGPVTNNPDAGTITIYVTPGVIGGSANVSSYDFENVIINTTDNMTIGYIGITNQSTVASNWTAQMVNATWTGGATAWTHSDTATAGNNTAGIKADTTAPWGGDDVAVPYSTSVLLKGNLAALTDFDMGLSLVMPTASSVKDEKSNVLEITVTVP